MAISLSTHKGMADKAAARQPPPPNRIYTDVRHGLLYRFKIDPLGNEVPL